MKSSNYSARLFTNTTLFLKHMLIHIGKFQKRRANLHLKFSVGFLKPVRRNVFYGVYDFLPDRYAI